MQFYLINGAGEQSGPYNVSDLKANGLTKDTLVWKEGMTDWLKAGDIPELKELFIAVPPPYVKKEMPPQMDAAQPGDKLRLQKKYQRFFVPAIAIILALGVGLYFFLTSRAEVDTANNGLSKTDSIKKDAVMPSPIVDSLNTDTVKIVDLDSLMNNLNWDSTNNANMEEGPAESPSFLPGTGLKETKPGKSKKKVKTTTKKERSEQQQTPDAASPQPVKSAETEKINPAKYLTITGGFRKNLLFEVVLSGIIQNKHTIQVRDIVVEASFLDASGQPIGSKRFIQQGPLAGGSSISFRYKTDAPKGTRGTKYNIISASSRQ